MTNLVNLWVNLFRAIEIAKTGGYSVSVYFDEDYKNGFDDYKTIKNFCKGWFDNFVSDGDIKVSIVKPTSYELIYSGETIEDISARIEKSMRFDKPELKLCDASKSLLITATNRLDLSLSQLEKIKQIAVAIAQIDYSKTVKPEHIAEAINYSGNVTEHLYNAESESKVFGGMIYIKLGEIDSDTIKSAISYLSRLLPENINHADDFLS